MLLPYTTSLKDGLTAWKNEGLCHLNQRKNRIHRVAWLNYFSYFDCTTKTNYVFYCTINYEAVFYSLFIARKGGLPILENNI